MSLKLKEGGARERERERQEIGGQGKRGNSNIVAEK